MASGEIDSPEQIALISRPRFGVGDRGTVTLTFSVYVSEHSGALQVFGVEEGAAIIEAYGGDVATLQGKPCWVKCERQMIRWIRPWKSKIPQ
jgi:hypothetical protein